MHGLYLADQRIHFSARTSLFRWNVECLGAGLGQRGLAVDLAHREHGDPGGERRDDGTSAPTCGADGGFSSGEIDPGISLGEEKDFPWLGLTVLLGVCFLVGQWLAWGELNNRGFYVSTNPSSSFAFLLTIAHAIHLTGGMIALIFAASASLLHKPLESRRISVDITAWYWHFMAVLWLYVFGLLAVAR